jgi:hypothetical protein
MITLPPETEQLARRVAEHIGKTPEEVLQQGVEMEARIAGVAVEVARARKRVNIESAREIARRIASRPLLDKRSPREILDEAWGNPG